MEFVNDLKLRTLYTLLKRISYINVNYIPSKGLFIELLDSVVVHQFCNFRFIINAFTVEGIQWNEDNITLSEIHVELTISNVASSQAVASNLSSSILCSGTVASSLSTRWFQAHEEDGKEISMNTDIDLSLQLLHDTFIQYIQNIPVYVKGVHIYLRIVDRTVPVAPCRTNLRSTDSPYGRSNASHTTTTNNTSGTIPSSNYYLRFSDIHCRTLFHANIDDKSIPSITCTVSSVFLRYNMTKTTPPITTSSGNGQTGKENGPESLLLVEINNDTVIDIILERNKVSLSLSSFVIHRLEIQMDQIKFHLYPEYIDEVYIPLWILFKEWYRTGSESNNAGIHKNIVIPAVVSNGSSSNIKSSDSDDIGSAYFSIFHALVSKWWKGAQSNSYSPSSDSDTKTFLPSKFSTGTDRYHSVSDPCVTKNKFETEITDFYLKNGCHPFRDPPEITGGTTVSSNSDDDKVSEDSFHTADENQDLDEHHLNYENEDSFSSSSSSRDRYILRARTLEIQVRDPTVPIDANNLSSSVLFCLAGKDAIFSDLISGSMNSLFGSLQSSPLFPGNVEFTLLHLDWRKRPYNYQSSSSSTDRVIQEIYVDTILVSLTTNANEFKRTSTLDSWYISILSLIHSSPKDTPTATTAGPNYYHFRGGNVFGLYRLSNNASTAINAALYDINYHSIPSFSATKEPQGLIAEWTNTNSASLNKISVLKGSFTILPVEVNTERTSVRSIENVPSVICRIQPSSRSNASFDSNVSHNFFGGNCAIHFSKDVLYQLYGIWTTYQIASQYFSTLINSVQVVMIPPNHPGKTYLSSSFLIQLAILEFFYASDQPFPSTVVEYSFPSGISIRKQQDCVNITIPLSVLSFHRTVLFCNTESILMKFIQQTDNSYRCTSMCLNEPQLFVDLPHTKSDTWFPWLRFRQLVSYESEQLRALSEERWNTDNASLLSFCTPSNITMTNASLQWFSNEYGTVTLIIGNGEMEFSTDHFLSVRFCAYTDTYIRWLSPLQIQPEHTVSLTSFLYAQTLGDASGVSNLLVHGDTLTVHATLETLDRCIYTYVQLYTCLQQLLQRSDKESIVSEPNNDPHSVIHSRSRVQSLLTPCIENYYSIPHYSLPFTMVPSSSLIHSGSNTSLVNLSSKSSESEFEDMRSVFDRWVQPFTHIENLLEPLVNSRNNRGLPGENLTNSGTVPLLAPFSSSSTQFIQRMNSLLPLLRVDTVNTFDTNQYSVRLSFLLNSASVSIRTRVNPKGFVYGDLTLLAKENKLTASWISTSKVHIGLLPDPLLYCDGTMLSKDSLSSSLTVQSSLLNFAAGSKIILVTENLHYSAAKSDYSSSITMFTLLGRPGTLNNGYTVNGSYVLYPFLSTVRNLPITDDDDDSETVPPLTGWNVSLSYDTASIYIRGRLIEWFQAITIHPLYTDIYNKLSTLFNGIADSTNNISNLPVFYSTINLPALTLRIDFIPEGSIRYLHRDFSGLWKYTPSQYGLYHDGYLSTTRSISTASIFPPTVRSVRLIPIHGLHLSLPTVSLSSVNGSSLALRKLLEIYTVYFTQESYRLFFSSLPSLLKADSQTRTNQLIDYNTGYSAQSSSNVSSTLPKKVLNASNQSSATIPFPGKSSLSQQLLASSVRIMKPLTTALVTATQMIGHTTMENINQGIQSLTQNNESNHEVFESTAPTSDSVSAFSRTDDTLPQTEESNDSYSLSLPREQFDQYIVLYRNHSRSANAGLSLQSNHNLVRMLATSATTVSIFATSGVSGVLATLVSAFAGRLVYTILENSSDGQYFQSVVQYTRRRIATTLQPYFRHTYALPFLLTNTASSSYSRRTKRTDVIHGSDEGRTSTNQSTETWEII